MALFRCASVFEKELDAAPHLFKIGCICIITKDFPNNRIKIGLSDLYLTQFIARFSLST